MRKSNKKDFLKKEKLKTLENKANQTLRKTTPNGVVPSFSRLGWLFVCK